MTAIREAIFELIEARLLALPGVGEVERMPSGDPASWPALSITDNGQSVDNSDTGCARYTLDVTVDGFVETANAHAALNELHAATVKALLAEPALGGLAETIEEGTLRVTVAPLASEPRLGFALDLVITFATARGDPAQPA